MRVREPSNAGFWCARIVFLPAPTKEQKQLPFTFRSSLTANETASILWIGTPTFSPESTLSRTTNFNFNNYFPITGLHPKDDHPQLVTFLGNHLGITRAPRNQRTDTAGWISLPKLSTPGF